MEFREKGDLVSIQIIGIYSSHLKLATLYVSESSIQILASIFFYEFSIIATIENENIFRPLFLKC